MQSVSTPRDRPEVHRAGWPSGPLDPLKRLQRSPLALPLAAIAAAAMLFVSETSNRRSLSAMDAVAATIESRAALLRSISLVADAESGQRGYLLTGRSEYLEPYETAVKSLDGVLARLGERYRDDPELGARFESLRKQIQAKLSELAVTIARQASGDRAGALDLVLTNIGEDEMDRIRATAEEMRKLEVARFDSASRSVRDSLLLNRIGVATITAFSLLALAIVLRQAAALDAQRTSQEQAVQAERDQLERQVLRRTQQLTELARHLQVAREDERSRLARELHDELGALFTAAKLDVARIKTRVAGVADAPQRLAQLTETLNHGIALKRRIIEDLRPSSLSNLGLVAALEIYLRDFAARSGTTVDSALETVALAADSELTIYRLVQEALTNVAKYARAHHVHVSLAAAGGFATVAVVDDGVGFDPSIVRHGAHGLMGMRYRVEGDGGSLTLTSAPGSGTRVEASLPMRDATTL